MGYNIIEKSILYSDDFLYKYFEFFFVVFFELFEFFFVFYFFCGVYDVGMECVFFFGKDG